MTIKDCTKDELIFIIKYLADYGYTNNIYYVQMALNEVEYKRERAKLDKADELVKIAHDARKQYCDFLKKYEGVPFLDIPQEEIDAAYKSLETAEKADKQYNKLMGIE